MGLSQRRPWKKHSRGSLRLGIGTLPRGSTSAAAKAEVSIEGKTRWGRRSAQSVQLPEGGVGRHGRCQDQERYGAHQPAAGTLKTDRSTHREKLTLKIDVGIDFYSRERR